MVEAYASYGDIRTTVVNAAGSSIAEMIARLLRHRGTQVIGLAPATDAAGEVGMLDGVCGPDK